MDDPLIWIRALHFGATMSVTGGVFFETFVAQPAFGRHSRDDDFAILVRSRVAWTVWLGLSLAVLSGAAWLFIMAAQMGETSWFAAISQGLAWTVLIDTDFGHDWVARLFIAALLAVTLIGLRPERASNRLVAAAACVLAAGLVGALAWAGHAAATPDSVGEVHLFADVLHLVAAGAWVGALVPLAILLGAAYRRADRQSTAVASNALQRFSTLGVISVGTLALTGVVNGWVLVGSISALAETDYGRLLLVKISLFFLMLAFAAVNRLRLTPTAAMGSNTVAAREALRKIQRNSLAEAAAAALIVVIVGWLGTIAPGAVGS